MYYDERKEVVAEAPIQLEPWRRTLLRAADYIRNNGWCQGSYYNFGSDGKTAVCMLGAIVKVENLRERDLSEKHPAVAGLLKYVGTPTVPAYNDVLGRTKEEVIAALEGAARAG